MKYSYELFVTDKQACDDTKYAYLLSGAFYDCYTDDFEHFYRPLSNKESLLARREFYQTYLKKAPYPVFNNSYQITNGQSVPAQVLFQVLGLPIQVRTKPGKENNVVPLTCDEILSRITFDPLLSVDRRQGLSKGDFHELFTNDFALIEGRNYLISKGIFCQNPELIYDPETRPYPYYPIHILEDRIPKKYLQEKETGAKLFRDFVSFKALPLRNAEDYQKYYAPLDHRSLEEMAQLAFHVDSDNTPEAEYERNSALRRYFAGLMGRIRNDYFRRYFLNSNICGFTSLDQDLGFDFTSGKHRAVGLNFTRYAGENKRILHTENGKVREEFLPVSYSFRKKDKKLIGQQFDFAFSYRDKHLDLEFIPAYFLKRMGRPYACYPFVKYFDFSSGDRESFLSLLPFKDHILTVEDFGYPKPYIGEYGRLFFDFVECEEEKNFYHQNKRRKAGLSFFDLTTEEGGMDFALHYDSNNKDVLALVSGDYAFYRKNQQKIFDELWYPSWEDYISSHISKDEKITPIMEIFHERNKGRTFLEAFTVLKLPEADKDTLLKGIYYRIKYRFLGSLKHENYHEDFVSKPIEPVEIRTDDKEYPYLRAYPFGLAYSRDGFHYEIDSNLAERFSYLKKKESSLLFGMAVSSYTGDSYRYGRCLFVDKLDRLLKDEVKTITDGLYDKHSSYLYPILANDSSLLSSVRQCLASKDGYFLFSNGYANRYGFGIHFDNIRDEDKKRFDSYHAKRFSGNLDAFLDNRFWTRIRDEINQTSFLPPLSQGRDLDLCYVPFLKGISAALQRKYWRRARGFTFDQGYLGSLEFDGHQVAIGTRFFAFKRPDGGYAIPRKDKEAVEFSARILKERFSSYVSKKEQSDRFLLSALGLPLIRDEPRKDFDEFVSNIRYEDMDADTSDYPTYFSAFVCRRSTLDSLPFTTEANRRLAHRGRFILYPPLAESLRNYLNRFRQETNPYDWVCIENPTGVVKDFFLPDDVSMQRMIDNFRQKSSYDSESAFFYKELLLYLYHVCPDILIQIANSRGKEEDLSSTELSALLQGFPRKKPSFVTLKTERAFLKDFTEALLIRIRWTVSDEAIKEKHEKELKKK